MKEPAEQPEAFAPDSIKPKQTGVKLKGKHVQRQVLIPDGKISS